MNSVRKFRAVVAGATGYSGRDLTRLLLGHPQMELTGAFASRNTGDIPLAEIHPQFTGMTNLSCRGFDEGLIEALRPDVIFLATPNEFSYEVIPNLLNISSLVVDISGAFRLRDASLYPTFYGFEHKRADLLENQPVDAALVRFLHQVATGGRVGARVRARASDHGQFHAGDTTQENCSTD